MNGIVLFLFGLMCGGLFGIFFMCLFIGGRNATEGDEGDAPPE